MNLFKSFLYLGFSGTTVNDKNHSIFIFHLLHIFFRDQRVSQNGMNITTFYFVDKLFSISLWNIHSSLPCIFRFSCKLQRGISVESNLSMYSMLLYSLSLFGILLSLLSFGCNFCSFGGSYLVWHFELSLRFKKFFSNIQYKYNTIINGVRNRFISYLHQYYSIIIPF